MEIAKERHTQAFEVVRVPQWVWEGPSADLEVVCLLPSHHYSSSPHLSCPGPALLPAWGGVTWAEGKLKHKVIVGKTVAGTFSRHPL